VDGSSLIFRSFFGNKADQRAPDGRRVNGVRGTLDSLARLLESRRPRSLAIASDEDWRPAFRVEAMPEYKSHRVAEPVPPELVPQLPMIEAVLKAIGLNWIGKRGYEAEDIIASLAAKLDPPIEVYSGDRDLFAIIRDPDVVILYPEVKTGLAEVDEAEVEKRYGIPGRNYAEFAILRGDPSDGLPGVPGVGAKTAAGLVRQHKTLDGILAGLDWSDSTRDYIQRARRVVYPVADLELPDPAPGLPAEPADPEGLARLNRELGIETSTTRLLNALRTNARL
jgi:5'-3' exonuclease